MTKIRSQVHHITRTKVMILLSGSTPGRGSSTHVGFDPCAYTHVLCDGDVYTSRVSNFLWYALLNTLICACDAGLYTSRVFDFLRYN